MIRAVVQIVRPRRRLGAPDRRPPLGVTAPAAPLLIRESDCRVEAVIAGGGRTAVRKITHVPSGETLLCGTMSRTEALRELERQVKASQWGRCYLRPSA